MRTGQAADVGGQIRCSLRFIAVSALYVWGTANVVD